MTDTMSKMVVAPVDGSTQALKAMDYLFLLYGVDHPLNMHTLYVMPALPPILVEESRTKVEVRRKLNQMDAKNKHLAQGILDAAKEGLLRLGFAEEHIHSVLCPKKIGVARDICSWSEMRNADAIVMCTQGKSRLQAFFMGETANRVLEASRIIPLWLVKGAVTQKDVLIPVDGSEASMRAVDHAAFMLSGTQSHISLFHAKRRLEDLVPAELLKDDPAMASMWRDAEGRHIVPFMHEAEAHCEKAGIDPERVTVKIVEGSRNPARDIIKAAAKANCGAVVMGKHGSTDSPTCSLGGVARKVVQSAENLALWLVP